MPDARLQRTRKAYVAPQLTVVMEPCPIPNLLVGDDQVVILNPDFAVRVHPLDSDDDSLIETLWGV